MTAFSSESRGLHRVGPPADSGQVLPHQQELTMLLRAVVNYGTARAAALDDDDVAGKTGTSQDYRDAWFVGFNKALVVGVWVGNDDRSPMKGVTGGSLPAEIWKRFLVAAKPLVAHLDVPATVEAPMHPLPPKQPQCDQAACTAAYHSFRSSDCTYQPYGGSRRLCDKGNSQIATRPDGGDSTRDTKLTNRENSAGNRTAKLTPATGRIGLRGSGARLPSLPPARAGSFALPIFEGRY
jgi:penicillin-binding protein 1A